VNELYISVGKDRYEVQYSTDPCGVSATAEKVFILGIDTRTGEQARIEINSEKTKEMLEGYIDRYLEIRREGDGKDVV
jgi:hypothetical protein